MNKTPRSIHHDSVLGNEQEELNEMLGTLRVGKSLINKVQATFDEIRDQGLLEDRREYTQEDLEYMYGLTGQQTEELFQMIQSEFEPKTIVKFVIIRTIAPGPYSMSVLYDTEEEAAKFKSFHTDVVAKVEWPAPALPAHAKLDRDGVVKALNASGYNYDNANIQSARFVKMSLSSPGVAIYEITYSEDDGLGTGDVYLEVVDGVIKGEF